MDRLHSKVVRSQCSLEGSGKVHTSVTELSEPYCDVIDNLILYTIYGKELLLSLINHRNVIKYMSLYTYVYIPSSELLIQVCEEEGGS